jgi:type VI secretion system protein VasD
LKKKMKRVGIEGVGLSARLWRGGFATTVTAIACALTGCGAWQATKDTTVDAYDWVFTTRVKQMNIDVDARVAVNETSAGRALSTVLRLYQLKDAKAFSQLEYVQLQNHDLELLKADLLATKDVVMRPGSSASVSEPMDKDTEYVGVVAFFRAPSSDGVWKLLIPKKQWKDTDPVKVHMQSNLLAFDGETPAPVKRDAPQQSSLTQKAQSDKASRNGDATSSKAQSIATTPSDATLGNSVDSPLINSRPSLSQASQAATSITNSVSSNASNATTLSDAASKSIGTPADSLKSTKATAGAISNRAAGLLSH